MNELDHLKRLSSVKTNAGVKFLTPAAFPGNHCPMHTSLALSSRVSGMSTLVVGTPECGTYSRNIIPDKYKKELHWTYILDSNEVVFGCRKGLIEAIKEMDKSGAKAIMIILTCVPEIIGEDIEGIIHEIQPEVKALLTYVLMGHFKCNSPHSGYWKTLLAFGDFMEKGKSSADTINVLGRGPKEKHLPMPKLLTSLEDRGFYLRMLAPDSDIEDFIISPNASLNLVVSPFMNPLAEMMWKKFQIPFISLHEFYSVDEIDNLYKSIEEVLGIRFNKEFDSIKEEAIKLEDKVKALFNGKKYILDNIGAIMPLPLVLYLNQLNISPLILHIDEFYPDDKKWAKAIKEKGQNPLVCHMVNNKTDKLALKEFDADFSLGDLLKDEEIPSVSHLRVLYGQVGYERTVFLLNKMLQCIEDTSVIEGGSGNGNS